ncbi:hypothetical protein VSR82_07935 [Burkholderia sp. JPY481]
MKMLRIAAGLALSACFVMFAGCTPPQQAQVASAATAINAQVKKACSVFNPVADDVTALYALNPKVDAAIDGVKALCVANASIDPTSVQTLSDTTLPAAIKALASLPGITAAQIQQVGGILTLVNTTLAIGLQVYGQPTAPAAASARAAASQ